MKHIKQLDQISSNDIAEVGGKASALGELMRAGLPVPPGFVLTTKAYTKYQSKQLPKALQKEILEAFDSLGAIMVAVRSSATVEDSQTASWAGQLDSYLNVTRETVINAIRNCWQSINSERVVSYGKQQKVPHPKLVIAVVIQKMVQSEISGVMFTTNPVTNNADEVMIEAGYGLGHLLVQGEFTPDNYVIDKKTLKVIKKRLGNQQSFVTRSVKDKYILNGNLIKELTSLAKRIEHYFQAPQDIEWAFEKDKISIVQSRPTTTIPMKAIVTLRKLFTREKGIWYAYLWNDCDRLSFSKYLGYNVKNNLFLRSGEKVSVWYDLEERTLINNEIAATLLSDKQFVPRLLADLENAWQPLGPYLERKKKIADVTDLKDYYTHLRNWWIPMTMLFSIPQDTLGTSDKRAALARERAEKYSDVMDTVWDTFWNKKPTRIKKLARLVTPQEAFAVDTLNKLQIAAIEKRSKGTGLLNARLYPLKKLTRILTLHNIKLEKEEKLISIKTFRGETACTGKTKGKVRVIILKRDIKTLQKGEILVSDMTSPEFVPAMQKASAIITDEGGIMCHAAIVARELKKPCIVGTKIATQVLKNGDMVEVDGENGIIRILR